MTKNYDLHKWFLHEAFSLKTWETIVTASKLIYSVFSFFTGKTVILKK